ncbi:alpha-ketoacid dehydrogenase subunit beta [Bordetella bronchiseptica]|uniref:alpha-ketoacid dehydrogenase subunit beta n=2 Tax=Bordetella bronchiseptica TaxID=518 RepID=UPI00028FA76D|nr:alpha-ketoacid dehydrogenase subunit beta [Bordetella bronchiseptica]KCV33214.1 TPP-dependent acetoin dehydrogenase complex, E1 component, beta subunit [Bordetella bronchiseptica 00-P-2730]AUL17531.1 alpha-ketoacid dehydrogenase subunit beta [Bordetella bronchiseptica]AWP60769.1 alpha-ketoacid dehydrogenase subunit beta [Bordetella bronchiseptica]AZW33057.1 alpha-ketoacid dehydrogenase subunit beta [Bordetella bronchiseptica]KAK70978.1 TPP-dependent acetoin dehydrogenase complex, E1 compone
MAELRFAHAINRALAECMEEDPMVFLFGEDIAEAGGPFGVTRGLHDRFGSDRIRDTPISEATMANAAVGAALSGLKPVLEIMFMDFMTLTMDALVNQAAKARFMFGGQASVPMVVRTPHGGGISAGPQHSQCLEAWFAHIPGLKVVCPSNPADAYGLLKSAIRDPDPVVFVENKALYAAKGEVPDDAGPIPLGQARIARAGRDLTVVSYGAMVHKVERAAEALARDGIEAEVLDLRSIQPWDEAAVLASLRRTHRLLIVHEAVEAFGVGAEIAARMADIGFDELDAPIVRVAAPFVPVPFAPSLEAQYQPQEADIIAAARKLCA